MTKSRMFLLLAGALFLVAAVIVLDLTSKGNPAPLSARFQQFLRSPSNSFRAALGNSDAQFQLSRDYRGGWGYSANRAAAAWYLRKSAENGNALAQYNLYMELDDGGMGLGLKSDQTEANYWLRKAADQGYGLAENILANGYLEGRGLPKYKQLAREWAVRADQHGVEIAKQVIQKIDGTRVDGDDLLGMLFNAYMDGVRNTSQEDMDKNTQAMQKQNDDFWEEKKRIDCLNAENADDEMGKAMYCN